MSDSNSEKLAWAAGFFDGEGHIGVGFNPYGQLRFSISQVDRRALDRFKDAVQLGTVRGPYNYSKNAKHSPIYKFSITTGKDIKKAVNMLWPWLGPVKREQAQTALDKFSAYPPRKRTGRKRTFSSVICGHPERKYRSKGMCNSCYQMHWDKTRRKHK